MSTRIINIRYAMRRDLKKLIEIDTLIGSLEVSLYPISISIHNNPSCSIFIAESGEKIAGFATSQYTNKSIVIHRLAVLPEYRRQRVGSLLFNTILEKAALYKKPNIKTILHENNYVGQLFLSSINFQANQISPETSEVIYLYKVEPQPSDPPYVKNRMKLQQ